MTASEIAERVVREGAFAKGFARSIYVPDGDPDDGVPFAEDCEWVDFHPPGCLAEEVDGMCRIRVGGSSVWLPDANYGRTWCFGGDGPIGVRDRMLREAIVERRNRDGNGEGDRP